MTGILSAMPEEISHLLNQMTVKNTIEKGQRTYYQGLLFGQECVLAFSRWGKVAAATTTTQMINLYPISNIIFSGVAGALQTNLNIGDIVLATKVFQYDMDASPLFAPMEIPLINQSGFDTDHDERLLFALTNFVQEFDKMLGKNAEYFNINQPKLHRGIVVSGDQFVHTIEQQQKILKLAPKALCAEMEGAAVAQVCYEYDIPFDLIRIISDKADDTSPIDFPKFTKQIAGKYTTYILKNYLTNLGLADF